MNWRQIVQPFQEAITTVPSHIIFVCILLAVVIGICIIGTITRNQDDFSTTNRLLQVATKLIDNAEACSKDSMNTAMMMGAAAYVDAIHHIVPETLLPAEDAYRYKKLYAHLQEPLDFIQNRIGDDVS